MARIIRFGGGPHHETQVLLPWYVTGRLDPEEKARLVGHLSECAVCRAELESERRLDSEIASVPLDVEQGWSSMLRRLEADSGSGGPAGGPKHAAIGQRARGLWRAGAPWLGWAVAAQVGLVLLLGTIPPRSAPARYHTLSAAPATASGNIIVLFRPDATEQAIREMLQAAGVRLVDGPTSAGAYVLRAPDAGRALAALRAQREVVLAQPLDAGEAP